MEPRWRTKAHRLLLQPTIKPICVPYAARVSGRASVEQIAGWMRGVTKKKSKQEKRLLRQFGVLQRRVPRLRSPIQKLLGEQGSLVRVPLAVLLLLGGLASVLPFLGLWMLPLGLLLLAVDLPVVQPAVAAAVIRGRRCLTTWRRNLRARWRRR